MTLRFPFALSPVCVSISLVTASICTLILIISGAGALPSCAQSKPAANSAPDVLVLSNGDILHGKFVSEVAGKVTFHTDPLGDVSLSWEKIKELHATERFAVLDKNVKLRGKKDVGKIPVGTIEVADQAITVHPEAGPPEAPIAVKNAQYVMDEGTLNKQVYHEPGFLSGWNGAADERGQLGEETDRK